MTGSVSFFRNLQLVVACVAFTVLTPVPKSAAQQTCAACSHPACCASAPVADACRVYMHAPEGSARWLPSAIVQSEESPFHQVEPVGCYDPGRVYGLQGWRFNIRGGHKIKRVKFMQRSGDPLREGGWLEIALHDHDGNDYMDGFVWLVPLPEGTALRTTRTQTCRGLCPFVLAPKNPTDIIVLAGFDVVREDGDGHVRTFSIGPNLGTETQPAVRVNFSDDNFAYRARIQYAYIPAGAVAANRNVVSQRYRRPSFSPGVVPSAPSPLLLAGTPRGNAVLQTFSLGFQDGGHFLEDVGLERRAGAYEAWFQDNQGTTDRRQPDDSFNWSAGFAILN